MKRFLSFALLMLSFAMARAQGGGCYSTYYVDSDLDSYGANNVTPPTVLINEGFDNLATALTSGWSQQNLSSPAGTQGYFQGNSASFPGHSGAANSYAGANFNAGSGLSTVNDWLLTPQVSLVNGGQFKFWARTLPSVAYPDRLQVRMSTAGASTNVGSSVTTVGDFTTLLLDINPTYTTTGFPTSWTEYTVTVSGITAPTTGRFAFRYFVENGGPSGANSDYIGIDDVNYSTPAPPTVVFNEGFDNLTTTLTSGWSQQNLSSPAGTQGYFQGNSASFPGHSGAANSYAGANFNAGSGLSTVNNWLITPQVTLVNGALFKFWARTLPSVAYPDRLQVRMSTAGASTNVGSSVTTVGDFTTLLLDINPTYTTTGFPTAWTEYTVTVTGITTPTTGRFAFRYFVENGGPSGANSDYIGIDDASYSTPSTSTILACGGAPAGYALANTDCNNSNAAINPGATEICSNGIDDNCDGIQSEMVAGAYDNNAPHICTDAVGYMVVYANSGISPYTYVLNTASFTASEGGYGWGANAPGLYNWSVTDASGCVQSGSYTITIPAPITVYADTDLDGYGAGAALSVCYISAGFVLNNTDCNDSDASANPVGVEICGNGIDEDCSGADLVCPIPGCMDAAACNYNSAATVDNGSCTFPSLFYYVDMDFDGFGSNDMWAYPTAFCSDPGLGWSLNNLDCNDNNDLISPAGVELCNGFDDNCNGTADDGLTFNEYFADADGDGFGTPASNYVVSTIGYQLLSPQIVSGNMTLDLAGRIMSYTGISINGATNTEVVAAGSTVSLTYNLAVTWGPNLYCPGCVTQSYIGIGGSTTTLQCENGIYDGYNTSYNSGTFTAPTTPGTYYLVQNGSLDYFCQPQTYANTPANAIAILQVEGTLPTFTNAGPNCDDCTAQVPIGFTFPFYGNTYSSLAISSNGFVSFDLGVSNGCCSGNIVPGADAVNNMIALGWYDLLPTGGQITYFNLYSPNRLVIQYSNAPEYSGSGNLNGQIVLFESGAIQLIYSNLSTSIHNATAGVENATGTVGVTLSGLNSQIGSLSNVAYEFINTPSILNPGVSSCAPIVGYVLNNTDCLDSNPAVNPSATEVCNGIDDNCNTLIDDVNIAFQPSYFPQDSWNLYAFNSMDYSSNYKGFYNSTGTGVNTINQWAQGASPSDAAGWNGCPVTIDNHTYSIKRQGFPTYTGGSTILLTNWDDDVEIFVNGTSVYTGGCCGNSAFVSAWSGLLDATSTIEVRIKEYGGDSFVSFDVVPNVPGCIVATACNYNALATSNDGSCIMPSLPYYADNDGDGYGTNDPGIGATLFCTAQSAPWSLTNNDCNDSNAAINPAASEVCNGIDDNCNGTAEEGLTFLEYFADADADGYGIPASTYTISPIAYNALTPQPLPSAVSLDLLGRMMNYTNISINGGTNAEIVTAGSTVNLTYNLNVTWGPNVYCPGCVTQSYIGIGGSTTTLQCESGIWDGYSSSYGAGSFTAPTTPGTYYLVQSATLDYFCQPQTFINTAQNAIAILQVEGSLPALTTAGPNCNECTTQIPVGFSFPFYGNNYTNAAISSEGFLSFNLATTPGCCIGGVVPSVDAINNGIYVGWHDLDAGSISYFNLYNPTRLVIDISASEPGVYDWWTGITTPGGVLNAQLVLFENGNIEMHYNNLESLINPVTVGVENANGLAGVTLSGFNSQLNSMSNVAYQFVYTTSPTVPGISSCSPIAGYAPFNTDCVDTNPAVNPGATEICNTIDDNCDGQINEGLMVTYYADADGDTFGTTDPFATASFCADPGLAWSLSNTDCNDSNAAINPAASEVCNGIDDNCNGTAEEGLTFLEYFADADADGYGIPASTYTISPIAYNAVTPQAITSDVTLDLIGRIMSYTGISINGATNTEVVAAGSTVSLTYNLAVTWGPNVYCPGCVTQSYIGLGGSTTTLQCENGIYDGYNSSYNSGTFTAPTTPGTYYLVQNGSLDFVCQPQTYANTPTNAIAILQVEGSLPALTTAGPNCAECTAQIPLGFSFPFYGNNYTNAAISSEGFLSFNLATTPGCCIGGVVPSVDAINNGIYVGWHDLNPGSISYFNLGNPNRLVIDINTSEPEVFDWWTGITTPGGVLNAQLVLFENGNIEMHYNNLQALVNPVTVGVENANGLAGVTLSGFNSQLNSMSNVAYQFVYTTSPTVPGISSCSPIAGYAPNNTDCLDTNPAVNPGATEVCNSIDDNCDGQIDEGVLIAYYADADADGFGAGAALNACTQPAGYVLVNTDCNDSNAAINPAAIEVCNTVDDNCDGQINEGFGPLTTYYGDADGDGYGIGEITLQGNSTVSLLNNTIVIVGSNGSGIGGQLTGSTSYIVPTTGTYTFDWHYVTSDWSPSYDPAYYINGVAYPLADNAGPNTQSGSQTVTVTAGSTFGFSVVTVDDGYGSATLTITNFNGYTFPIIQACSQPAGYALVNGDCNDAVATTHPNAPELCNGIDDNCNGVAEEGLTFTNYYVDTDADGFGAGTAVNACAQPVGYVLTNTDCNNTNANIKPGIAELCTTAYDDNCNGLINEGCVTAGENPSNAISITTSIWPACTATTGTLVGASASTSAQTICLTGEDRWHQFVATSEGVSIVVNSTTANIVIELQTAAGVLVAQENAVSGLGGEILNHYGLTAGQVYKVGVRNYNSAQGTGTYSICAKMLKRGGCDYGPGPYTLCQYFKATWAGATGTNYTYTFTGVSGPASGNVYTRTQNSDICVLSNVLPTLPYGSTYNVLITNIYTINDGAGVAENISVPALSPCTMSTTAQPVTALRTTDQCAAGPRFRGAVVAALPWVCGSTNWRWEFTELNAAGQPVGLPITVNRGAASNYITLSTIAQLQYGKTYNVRTAPILSYTGTNYQWGTTTCMSIVGTAGMIADGQDAAQATSKVEIANEANMSLYPNPTHGTDVNINLSGVISDNVQIRVVDAMGRQVWSNRYSVNGILNTNITFEQPLANGLYFVEAIYNGELQTQRMMVQR